MDGILLMGGTSADPIAHPLPSVHGRALGEISGTIHVHLREQGRPQGAGFSAGDLSHRSSRSEFRRYRRVPLARLRCPRGNRHRHYGGDIGRAQRTRAAGGATGSCNPHSRSLTTAALRSGGADRPPRETRCACTYYRERGICGPWADVPDLGARSICRARGCFARARAPRGDENAVARCPCQSTAPMIEHHQHRSHSEAQEGVRQLGAPTPHIPVLVDAVLATLAPRDDALYLDATFGRGGYSAALLAAARCRVVGFDRDPEAIRYGRELAEGYSGRLIIIEGRFGDMVRLLAPITSGPIAGIAFDLGVSSVQLDRPERGFSFRFDGPLDMRMS